MAAPFALLLTLLSAHLALAEPSVQRIHRTEKTLVATHAPPRSYPCMDDWNKICHKDSDCCSGSCLALFCRIVGVERPTTRRPPPKLSASEGKRRRKKTTTSPSPPMWYNPIVNNKLVW